MEYISRRLSITTDKDERIISEPEFLALPGPLVILGEPGAGKSEFVRQLKQDKHTSFYTASALISFPMLPQRIDELRVVVDAIDEVTAYGNSAPFPQVLQKIAHHDISRFIFTCRSVDWQVDINSDLLFVRWQQKPIIGKLLPLNDDEIIRFVNVNGSQQDGKEFLETAHKHNSIDLLRNPQTLTMLMRTVALTGWAENRAQLYEESCKLLIREDNIYHKSINQVRPSGTTLLDCAGFVSAQLILANKVTINLQGKDSEGAASLQQLSSDAYDPSVIRQAVSTKIFRTADADSVEGSHRTLLEYLGAKYIVKEVGKSISIARLETLLYAGNGIVPPALRGLHAWIATLQNGSIAKEFISRDPYGVFRYGDSSALSIDLLRHLLACLHKHALDDPHFRNEDWHVRAGKGFANPLLKDDILALLANPDIPYPLVHLVLSSVLGEKLANQITDDLIKAILDSSKNTAVRNEALDVLQGSDFHPDWNVIVNGLIGLADMESLRMALDIIRFAKDDFAGKTIAQVLIGISIASRRGPLYASIGYGLPEHLNENQVRDTLAELLQYGIDEGDASMPDDPKGWVADFLLAAFRRNIELERGIIWQGMEKIKHHHRNDRNNLDKASANYFVKYPTLRAEVQWEALFNNDGKSLWWNYFRLPEASPALAVTENDMLIHIDRILKVNGPHLLARWTSMAWYSLRNPNFTGISKIIDAQARRFPEFAAALAELKLPPKQEEDSYKRETKDWERRQETDRRKRHESYENVRDHILAGTHLQAINHIAKAYLGWIDSHLGTPAERVADLVGDNLAPHVLGSFKTAVDRGNIPSARSIVELNVLEKKEYFIEPILIVAYSFASEKDSIPFEIKRSILAACRWGFHFHGDKITPGIQAQLEKIVFSMPVETERFLRDTLEPRLITFTEHISGLERIGTDECFSSVAGALSLEWLERFDNVSVRTLHDLLKAALRYTDVARIVSIAKKKIARMDRDSESTSEIWHGILFLFDFENSRDQLLSYMSGDSSRFWGVRQAYLKYYRPHPLSPEQNYFILSVFEQCFSETDDLPTGFMGGQHPWDAADFMLARALELASNVSEITTELLNSLLKKLKQPTRLHDHLKHVWTRHVRLKAESKLRDISLDQVRSILLNQVPQSLSDLQSVIIEQLSLMQRRIRNNPTNDYLVFWNSEFPHDENYCRDRIVSDLTPHLDNLGIRIHTEGRMPDNNRCDFLCVLNQFDHPVEVKGQWHNDLWTTTLSQLEDYTREYRADGYGIILAIWFGHVDGNKTKKTKPDLNGRTPSTVAEFEKLLQENYREKLSSKTKIFVLDVSKSGSPARKQRKRL